MVDTYNLPMAAGMEWHKKWGWQMLVEVPVERTLATREFLHRALEACSPPQRMAVVSKVDRTRLQNCKCHLVLVKGW